MKSLLFMAAAAATALGISTSAVAADYYYKETKAAVALSDSPGTPVAVVAVQLPAGTWIVNAKASLVNFGDADFARCTLYSGSTVLNGASTMTGVAGSMPAVATVAIIDLVATTATRSLTLKCHHDGSVPGQYVDPDAAIVATRAPGTR